MNLSLQNRIAFYYMLATALIVGLVFGLVYFMVGKAVYLNLDNDLAYEARKHTGEIRISGDSILFLNKAEWAEKEHREIQVNPVFIQIIDREGRLMDKSPNLKEAFLPLKAGEFGGHFNGTLNDRAIRQVQIPIEQNGKIKGFILAAVSSEASRLVVLKLRNMLLISYLVLLSGLFFISRILAGHGILPLRNVNRTIRRITSHNLNERVALPGHKDEMYELASGFNALLDRVEKVLERERQFTSDASHELRTPLATLRGTLEVLIRRGRSQQDYEEKIRYSLEEIERMTATLEQLLLLARLEDPGGLERDTVISLATLLDETLSRHKSAIASQNLKVNLNILTDTEALVPQYYSGLILENIVGNAVKYSRRGAAINLSVLEDGNSFLCDISDEGIGIREEDIDKLFNPFFRSDALLHRQVPGTGLGLSIAKKAADAIGASIAISSVLGQGTKFSIAFLSKS
jgi:signal transduction histidine kinase